MHGLVIKQAFRQQQLATQLLQHVLTLHINQTIICFAEEKLSLFYHKNAFYQVAEQQLVPPLLKRYLQYKKTNNKLLVFSCDRKVH